MSANAIGASLNQALLSLGPLDPAAQSALASTTQIASGVTDLNQGDFFQIYQNLILSQSMSKLFADDDDSASDDSAAFSGLGGDFQALLGSLPGVGSAQNLEISHVELDGDEGKVVFKDGSSQTVPVQAPE